MKQDFLLSLPSGCFKAIIRLNLRRFRGPWLTVKTSYEFNICSCIRGLISVRVVGVHSQRLPIGASDPWTLLRPSALSITAFERALGLTTSYGLTSIVLVRLTATQSKKM